METDHAFTEIFGRRPDWMAELIGPDGPGFGKAQPEVFKTAVECDLVLTPDDPQRPHCVCEFQFYFDHSIWVRTDMARLALWRRINSKEDCRKRDYAPRLVMGIVVFGERSLVPPGAESFAKLRAIVLPERLKELELNDPSSAMVALLRPVTESDEASVEARAATDYNSIRQHPQLSQEERLGFSSIFMQFLVQRLRTKSPEEIRAMIQELTPIEETRTGRELIEKGIERGIEKGIERGIEKGIERGIEKGIEAGIEKGRETALADIALALLERRLGPVEETLRFRIVSLPVEKLKSLALAVLDFQSEADLDSWLGLEG